ncbi:hypothetical protein GGE07_005942 [Sinorhizobium terangae]|uniref:Uncharacterized protein n=1 Tax=Sinorhizobium terangae TaxID=110322 RepID=A0A6N7LI37_SINTE|nr:hypothetical protein [Sinorhizobium terangae]MBB4189261.1 hypothetical protein [Sinorhizobium terangae]MQX17452.1 hypothetical protein [Sinorhizobium terangae]
MSAQRIGSDDLQDMLKASVNMALDTGTATGADGECDDAAKAIAYSTDDASISGPSSLALRQVLRSYTRACGFRRIRRELEELRIYLGRLFSDICCKIAGNGGPESRLAAAAGLSRYVARRLGGKCR